MVNTSIYTCAVRKMNVYVATTSKPHVFVRKQGDKSSKKIWVGERKKWCMQDKGEQTGEKRLCE